MCLLRWLDGIVVLLYVFSIFTLIKKKTEHVFIITLDNLMRLTTQSGFWEQTYVIVK